MNFLDLYRKYNQWHRNLPREVGHIAVNHFLKSFDKEGLEGEPKWVQRKDGTSAGDRSTRRALLVKSGALRRSIRIARLNSNSVSIGSDMIYAKIQNEGGTTNPTVTPKMRKHAWAMYKKTKNIFWKNLATTKKTQLVVNIPARPFMKITFALKQEIRQHIRQSLSQAFL